jgi:hypothetical protein
MKIILTIGFILFSISVFSQSNLRENPDTLVKKSTDTISFNMSSGKIIYDTVLAPVYSNIKGSAVTYEKIVMPRKDTTINNKEISPVYINKKED